MKGLLNDQAAIVTGADHPTGLGALRALSAWSAKVTGFARNAESPTCRSRHWSEVVAVAEGESAWVEELLRHAEKLDRPAFLLPTQDNVVEILSERRGELAEPYRIALPEHSTVQLLLDKTRFFEWAVANNFPVPPSRIVKNERELLTTLREMPYPLVIKPLYRTAEWNAASPVQKVIRLNKAEEFRNISFDLFSLATAFVISHWIEGPDSAVHYCLAFCGEPGVMSASLTGRKLLQYPRQTGSTAICTPTDNEELRELTAALFRRCSFKGLGSLEVKYASDGQPYITEPTVGRPNLQSFSSVAAGINLHAMAMAHGLGVDAPMKYRQRRVVWFQEDAVFELARNWSREPVEWRLILASLWHTRRIAGAYWSWLDPRPMLALIYGKLQRLARRLRS